MKELVDRLTSDLNGRVDHATLESVRGRLERALRDMDRSRREAEANTVRLAAEVDRLGAMVAKMEREVEGRDVQIESLEQRLEGARLGRERAEKTLDEAEAPVIDMNRGVDWEMLDTLKIKCEGPKAVDFCSELLVVFRHSCITTALAGYDLKLVDWLLKAKPSTMNALLHLSCSELTFWAAVYGDRTKRKFRFKGGPMGGILMTDRVKKDLGPSPKPIDVAEALYKGDVVIDGDHLKAKGE